MSSSEMRRGRHRSTSRTVISFADFDSGPLGRTYRQETTNLFRHELARARCAALEWSWLTASARPITASDGRCDGKRCRPHELVGPILQLSCMRRPAYRSSNARCRTRIALRMGSASSGSLRNAVMTMIGKIAAQIAAQSHDVGRPCLAQALHRRIHGVASYGSDASSQPSCRRSRSRFHLSATT